MKLLQSFGVAVLVASAFVGVYRPTLAQAQIAPVNAQFPPALRAAILSGNSDAIVAAINTLSAGNPTLAANLAAQTASFAESMVATNPQAALATTQAALSVASRADVQAAAPQQAMNIASVSSRIVANPAVQFASPSGVATAAMVMVRIVSIPSVFATSRTAGVAIVKSSLDVAKALPSTNATQVGEVRQSVQDLFNNTEIMLSSPELMQLSADEAARNDTLSVNTNGLGSNLVGPFQGTTDSQAPEPESEAQNNASPT